MVYFRYSNMNYLSLSLTITLSSVVVYILWRKWRKSDKDDDETDGAMKLNVPESARSYPLVGNLIQLGDRPHETMYKWVQLYGPVYKCKLGAQLVVVLNGTDIVREALIDHAEEFAGRPKLYMIHATLKGKGLISSPYNQDFNEHKKFLINAINKFGRRRSSLEVNCLQTVKETLDSYRERIDHNFEYVNNHMKNTFSQIASQNVLTMTFGRRMYDESNFSKLMDLITENFRNTAVAHAYNFLPVTRLFKSFILKNILRCSEFLNNLISEKLEEFHESLDVHMDGEGQGKNAADCENGTESNIIESYLKELMNNSCFINDSNMDSINSSSTSSLYEMRSRKLTEKRRSSLSIELQNGNITEFLRKRSHFKSFSFDHLSSLVQDLFIAGTETISVAINWAIIYAAYFQDCQTKVIDEIDQVLGHERQPSEAYRLKLPYVEAFLNETLRYHCSGPILIPRSTTRDVVFRGYNIPEDTFVLVNMWSCMRDGKYWHEPDKFNPSRFLDETGRFKNKNPAMMPFSVGKRACIGESIARLQLFLVFTSLMQKFSVTFANECDAKNEKILEGIPGVGLNPPNVSLKLKLR